MMKRVRTETRRNSILTRIFLPMAIVIAIQSVLFLSIFYLGGVSDTLDSNAYEVLSERVESRRKGLENTLTKWINLSSSVDTLSSAYQDYLTENWLTPELFNGSPEHKKAFLDKSSEELIRLLRQNGVNGVFLILTDGDTITEEESSQRYGLGIRDMDQDAGARNNKDLLLERAPVTVARDLGFSLTSWWDAFYDFSAVDHKEFFTKPAIAAQENPDVSYKSLGYWCAPHRLAQEDTSVVSYSIPLRDARGELFAVLGTEVTTAYIESLLPGSELDDTGNGAYMVATRNEAGAYSPLVCNEYNYIKLFGNQQGPAFYEEIKENWSVYRMEDQERDLISCIGQLKLYDAGSPFREDMVFLVGSVSSEALLDFSDRVRTSIFLAVGISFLIGVMGITVVSRRFSRPIMLLSDRVKRLKPSNNFNLGRVNIMEIDNLIDSIEQLNKNAKEYENKISEIIQMSDLPIGTFEVNLETGMVFVSEEFYKVAGSSILGDGIANMTDGEKMRSYFDKLSPFISSEDPEKMTVVYQFPGAMGGDKWVTVKLSRHGEKFLGLVMDTTAEHREKQKIEYERDHDILTNLLNRRAFHKRLNLLFRKPEGLGVAAMLMMDVDNLKYVNDTYGHDYGDMYLRGTASVLRNHAGENSVLSRVSGDEFMLFLYATTEKKVMEAVNGIREELKESYITLSDGNAYRIRLSGGIAWYPKDSRDCNELIRYADYAMFQIKKNIKGEFLQFDRELYEKNSYLVESGDEVIRLIENDQIEYYLQPIVDVAEGRTIAYEALMRPQSSTVKTPLELLALARTQGRLYQIERFTWLEGLRKFSEYADTLMKDKKLFLNTIPNQVLSDFDYDEIYAKYGYLLSRVVVELTEEDKPEDIQSSPLIRKVCRWGTGIAIDDYGSGYNGQSLLLDIKADYVKIDGSLIRNIERDQDRQEVVRGLVAYAADRQISIIAEGVETAEELACVMKIGIRYVQGFLLGRPAAEPPLLRERELEVIRKCRRMAAQGESEP